MEFRTYPKQFEDYIFWPIIRTIWEPFSLKRSHWWHWINYDKNPSYVIPIPMDKTAKQRHTAVVHNLIQTNFGWKKISVLKPKNYLGNYRCGFTAQEGTKNKKQICSLILKGPVAVLLGPYNFKFFAETYPEKNPFELELIEITTKNNLGKNIPII